MTNFESIFNTSQQAYLQYKHLDFQKRAEFLESIAKGLEVRRVEIVPIACQESNLPEGRITGELGRTVGQIRLFANLLKEGAWVEAVIDHGDPDRTPVPKPDIRRMLTALGPVVVFGASNFPLAFSTAGGDTISALAAGCSVVYKGHPAHPQTSLLVAEIIQEAIRVSVMPTGVFIHVEGGIAEGQALVVHPLTKAVAFTGSFSGGKAIYDAAQQREEPIPVFAEMGSVNPIFVFEQKLQQELSVLAKQFASSLTLGAGQFCTNPGLIFVPSIHAASFGGAIQQELEKVAPASMLHEGIASAYYHSLGQLSKQEVLQWLQVATQQDMIKAYPSFAQVHVKDWLKNSLFQQEVFGCFAMMVVYESMDDINEVAKHLHGQLTISIWAGEEELNLHPSIVQLLTEKCGRLLFKGVPTGVEVGYAMQHGGPFPATTDSRSTSVGAFAIKRFARPLAYQDMPVQLLPLALRDENPLGIWRMVDGVFGK
ncbi:aldehyde dehydrogenase (NADP(+)) [Mongoliitalea daihaiensis]|uniref:aldehyde dehydrogenase (NADP(+)) n=1 Tax=Mongoliitalea daihaiensis TaxID=2782006 RepID=UPI001F35ADEC|nr:aldehyde dehydrogenase (NADP(+)) [Mongoliitalea daihaiensis]UJP66384.1 aldehyde dehydrogenase (NADP(+)) [Mongoliitalea daihaiensis]